MRKTLLWVLLVWAAPGPARAAVKNPGVFTQLTTEDVDSLDPAWAYDTASQLVIANVYDTLLGYKPGAKLALEPRLATEVPTRANGLMSKDGLTYRFPIRRGVRFQDGSPLTPEDVRYSLLRFMFTDRPAGPSALLLEPVLGVVSTRDAKGGPRPGLFERAEKAVRVEGDEVVVRLSKPFSPFLSILPSYGAIVSKSWCAARGDWDGTELDLARLAGRRKEDSPLDDRMNGTGAFSLERLDRRAGQVVLKRFDGSWRGKARLSRVVIENVAEFSTRKLMLQAGDADSIWAPLMLRGQLEGLPGVRLTGGLRTLEAPTTLFFTTKLAAAGDPNIGSGRLDGRGIPPDFFADRDARAAFAYAFDSAAYVRDVLGGQGEPASGYIPRELTAAEPGRKPLAFDPQKAAAHLKRAWGGRAWKEGFRLTILINDGSPSAQALADMLKKNVESLNPRLRVDVRAVQWSSWLAQTAARQAPAFFGGWSADYPDPHDIVFPLLHSRGHYAEMTGFSDPELDALIEKASRELDPAARAALYRRVEARARTLVPSVPLFDASRLRVERDWVRGYVFSPVFPDAPYGADYFTLDKAD